MAKYTVRFRADVVAAVIRDGLSCAEASRRYGPTEGTIQQWVARAKQDTLEVTSQDWVIDLETRLTLLEQQVLRLRQEMIDLAARPVPRPSSEPSCPSGRSWWSLGAAAATHEREPQLAELVTAIDVATI